MNALFKYAIVLSLGLAAGFIVKGPLNLEDVAKVKWLEEINAILNQALVSAKPAADVVPIDPAAAARIDEDVDYRIAQRIGSLEGWRSFLAAHGNSAHAQFARAEAQVLAGKSPAQAVAEASNGASTDPKAANEVVSSAPPSPGRRSVRSSFCRKAPGQAVADASNGASTDPKAVNEVVVSAPHSAGTEVVKSSFSQRAPAQAAVEASNGAATDAETANEVVGSPPPSARTEVVEAQVLAGKASAQVALEASNGAATNAKAVSEAVPSVPPSRGTEVAALGPDEICNREGDRLERLRNSPTSHEAARFANELSCEKLRPQLLGLMESLGYATPAQASAPSNPSAKVGSTLGPATMPPSGTRWTASSRGIQPTRHANRCAFKSICFSRASSLPPILLALVGVRPKNSSAFGHTLTHARPNDLRGR